MAALGCMGAGIMALVTSCIRDQVSWALMYIESKRTNNLQSMGCASRASCSLLFFQCIYIAYCSAMSLTCSNINPGLLAEACST